MLGKQNQRATCRVLRISANPHRPGCICAYPSDGACRAYHPLAFAVMPGPPTFAHLREARNRQGREAVVSGLEVDLRTLPDTDPGMTLLTAVDPSPLTRPPDCYLWTL
jgi:hypothetical protein